MFLKSCLIIGAFSESMLKFLRLSFFSCAVALESRSFFFNLSCLLVVINSWSREHSGPLGFYSCWFGPGTAGSTALLNFKGIVGHFFNAKYEAKAGR